MVSEESVPWIREDYIAEIASIEQTITQRRINEFNMALVGGDKNDPAILWMQDTKKKIDGLREEMGAL